MKKILLPIIALALTVSGCGIAGSDTSDTSTSGWVEDGYLKVTMTADISVYNDGSIPDDSQGLTACFSQGYIGSELYFSLEGGEVVAQDSFVKLEGLNCVGCEAEITSNNTEVPIELKARLELGAIERISESGEKSIYEEFTVWYEDPFIKPVNVRYSCPTDEPSTSTDYGAYMTQLINPFYTQVWSFGPTFNEVYTSTFTGYELPPTYLGDIEFNILEEYVESID